MNLSIKMEQAGQSSTLFLQGEVDAFTAAELKKALLPLAEQEKHVITLDLRNVSYMDSTGIGVLIAALKTGKQQGSEMRLTNVPQRIERLFRITGLHHLVPITPLEGEGL